MFSPFYSGCLERRHFITRTLASATFGALSLISRGRSYAESTPNKTLVMLFLRGGNDGLNTIVPFGDPYYYQHRPTAADSGVDGSIGIPIPDSNDPTSAVPLTPSDTYFGFNPLLAYETDGTNTYNGGMKPLYEQDKLAIFTATSYNNSSLSHFLGQDAIESAGVVLNNLPADGWLNRYLQLHPANVMMQAATIGAELTKSLRGPAVVPSFASLSGYNLGAPAAVKQIVDDSIDRGFAQTGSPKRLISELVHAFGRQLQQDITTIEALLQEPMNPNGAQYPVNNPGSATASVLGNRMRDLAHLIRYNQAYNLGIEVVAVDHTGGYDTHNNQALVTNTTGPGGNQGRLHFQLSQSLKAFHDDLGPTLMENVVVIVGTEFGRTVAQNGSLGTDHGKGTCWFVTGGDVIGGLYNGASLPTDDGPRNWAGLHPDRLDAKRYVKMKTSYKDIVADVLTNHMGVNSTDLQTILPSHTPVDTGMFSSGPPA